MATKFPRTLSLRPGLRWRGHLRIVAEVEDGYIVAFNAVDDAAHLYERYIYDRAVLTRQQLRDWTGVVLDERRLEP